MKKVKILFIVLVATLLCLPWFNLPDTKIAGREHKIPHPEFSLENVLNKKFQSLCEKKWNRHFGLRGTMLVAKNSIYDVLNLGLFHSGHRGNVLQGRDGVLYEKVYILAKYKPYQVAEMKTLAAETTDVFAALRDRLHTLGKSFILVMAPSKVDLRPESLPYIWNFRQKHIATPSSLIPLWESALRKRNILYVNALSVIQDKNLRHTSFPDPGTHWSMLASGYVWEETVRVLRSQDSSFPHVRVCGERVSSQAKAEELDLAKVLNIRPKYSRGNQTWKLAQFDESACKSTISTIVVGDSFSNQFTQSIIASNFSSQRPHRFLNTLPTEKQWCTLVDKCDVVVLIYTYPKLREKLMKRVAQKLLDYTEKYIESKHDSL